MTFNLNDVNNLVDHLLSHPQLLLQLIQTIILFLTLIFVIWYTVCTSRILKQEAGSRIFEFLFRISEMLIKKDSVSNKKRIFDELFAPKDVEKIEGIPKEEFNEEEIELGAFIMLYLSFFEYIWGAKKYGILGREEWNAWVEVIKSFFESDRVKLVWSERKDLFDEDFRRWIEKEILFNKDT